MSDAISVLERALARERAARKQAEKILEEKAAELYQLNQKLTDSNKKIESLFKAAKTELTGVFTNLADAYMVMDMSCNIIKMNDAAKQLLGYDNSKENLNFLNIVAQDHKDQMGVNLSNLRQSGTLKDCKIQIDTFTKEVKILHINCSLMYKETSNEPVAIQAILRDITQQVIAEQELKASENKLSLIVENLEDGLFLVDDNDVIKLVNKRMCELFQLQTAPDLLMGQNLANSEFNFDDVFENSIQVIERYQEIVKEKETVLGEELHLKSGLILERNYIPVFEEKKFKGHLWSFKDVTLQKRLRKGLEVEKEKYSSIIANMNLGLVEIGNDRLIQKVNQSFELLTGYTAEELKGKKGADLLLKEVPESLKTFASEINQREHGVSSTYEIEGFNKSGEKRYWLVSGAPNYTLSGEHSGSIGIVLDITEIRNLQLQKEALADKLEKSNIELQEYAHIVSHDLKSPLRSIYALVSWLKEDNEGKLDEISLENFRLIETTLEKMEQLITDILTYSSAGSEVPETKNVALDQLLKEMLQLLYIPEHVSIHIQENLPVLKGDNAKIQQVFQNLISNAIKFMDKEQGEIEVGYQSKRGFHEFYVKDNGMGIDEKYHQKIFEIFHSLNKGKDSTGIGLSIVKKIVNFYKGDIWVESKPGKGTTFRFTIKK